MARNTTKTFEKDGKTRLAHSPADAVSLRFDGWVEQTETDAKPSAAKPAAAPAGKANTSN